jgi:hypothetical protein
MAAKQTIADEAVESGQTSLSAFAVKTTRCSFESKLNALDYI